MRAPRTKGSSSLSFSHTAAKTISTKSPSPRWIWEGGGWLEHHAVAAPRYCCTHRCTATCGCGETYLEVQPGEY